MINKVRILLYEVKRGIRNVIRWFPVIWKDEDWDELYIYVLLHKKISNKLLLFRSTKNRLVAENNDEIIEQLDVVQKALERLVDDECYYLEACKFYEVNPYDNSNQVYKNHLTLVFAKEEELRMRDIRAVFSDEVSSQIRGWWD